MLRFLFLISKTIRKSYENHTEILLIPDGFFIIIKKKQVIECT